MPTVGGILNTPKGPRRMTEKRGGCPISSERQAHHRIDALEREVAELRASLAEVRRMTLGYRWANSPDSEDRSTYQAGVE